MDLANIWYAGREDIRLVITKILAVSLTYYSFYHSFCVSYCNFLTICFIEEMFAFLDS